MSTLDKIIDQIECRAGAGDVITIDQLKQIRKEHNAAIAKQISKNRHISDGLLAIANDASDALLRIEANGKWNSCVTLTHLLHITPDKHHSTDELREELAAYAHDTWSGWMMYMLRNCSGTEDGSQLIPKWAVDRWTRQSQMPYSKLSEDEKKSDRAEADDMLKIFRKHLLLAVTRVE